MAETKPHIDQQIIQLLHSSDEQALVLIFRYYRKALFGILLKILGDEKLAEDVFQESLVKVWNKRDSFDPSKGRFFTWILNIFRNTALDMLRSKAYKMREKTQNQENFVYLKAEGLDYEIYIDHIGLNKIVGRLEPKYRELINLVYFGGRTHSEAAEELDLSLGTVKTRLRKAIMILRTWIRE